MVCLMSLYHLRSVHSVKWKECCKLEIDGHGRFYIRVHQRGPASWLGGQSSGFDSRLYYVRFSLKGEDAHLDHGLGSW